MQFGEKGRNILQIKKFRNLAKFKKNDKIKRNLSMKWRNMAEYQQNLAKYGEPPAKYSEIRVKKAKFCGMWQKVAKFGEKW